MHQPRRLPWLGLLVSLSLTLVGAAPTDPRPPDERDGVLDDPHEGRFVYLRSGAPIVLDASRQYAAVLASGANRIRGPVTPPDGLELDPRGSRPDLIERGVTLFRVPNTTAPRGLEPEPADAWLQTIRSGLPAQPVFEHGAALRIPSDEVVVGFDPATTLELAKSLLSGALEEVDARGVRELRPGTFVCALRDASPGRAFEASRTLAAVDGVHWAEPSFINLHLETPGGPPAGRGGPGAPSSLTHWQALESKYIARLVSTVDREPDGFVWRAAIDGHLENDIDRWQVARDDGSSRILPVVVRDRTHDGRRAVYMTGKGLAGTVPPAPYREGASTYLVSPVFDLSAYPEAFVELWFWARFEDPVDAPRRVRDAGRVLLLDVESNEYVYSVPIAPVGPSGDLTRGTRTDRGWRKLMFRIPPGVLVRPLQVLVNFISDGIGGSEGMFVDDIRVLYSTGDGGDPFSPDPAAVRQYELMPRGQIAGHPARDEPAPDAVAAWSAGIPKQDVIVAILDDGVEPGHPDLAYWEPVKDEDGEPPSSAQELFPGEPAAPEDRHGTACAGVLGAVANDGIGFAGVAPGARLLPLHRGVDDLSIVQAIDAAVRYGAHVLVIPWGWTDAAPTVITRAILDAIDAGTTVVAAAGDGVHRPYSDALDYPCAMHATTSLICAGASSVAGEPKGPASADGLYWWSSAESDTGPDVLAPGTWLHATDRRGPLGYNDGSQTVPPDWTDEFGGTGASACYVGGVAALMAARDPLLGPEELKRMLLTTATDLPPGITRGRTLRLVAPTRAAQAAADAATARDRDEAVSPSPSDAIEGR